MCIFVRIHNNSLGKCVSVESIEAGVEFIKTLAAEEFGQLTDEQIEEIENDYEITFDQDPDNITTFALGIIEEE